MKHTKNPKAKAAVVPSKASARASTADGKPKLVRRKSLETKITPQDRVDLYAIRQRLSLGVKQRLGLQLPFISYFQDPLFAKNNPDLAFDEELFVDWEPGLSDGPTSARFAVVDFNADTGTLAAPAQWDEAQQRFVVNGKPLSKANKDNLQFHQVNVWALLQRALAFFEDGNGLGRKIPWAFEGNRLIVVPHAGYGENAFYDRESKSLQFYYFESGDGPVYTCLSADIVNHEFAHAVLDGVRPYYNESISVQTAAFHEFMGDLTAVLLSLRNNVFRRLVAQKTNGKFEKAESFASIAEEFGKAVSGQDYLRTAINQDKLTDLAAETSAHRLSEVLTGAMFDVLIELGKKYQTEEEEPAETNEDTKPSVKVPRNVATPARAFWNSAERIQRMAVQPLDLLPPVEVTFRDYALAVCRAAQLSDPLDPRGYYDMLIKIFRKRGILTQSDEAQLKKPQYLYDRLRLSVRHNIDDISRSRAAAYRFLDDNREDLLIPANQDFFISDLYNAKKFLRQGVPMPRQIVLEYVWREDVPLEGSKFGAFNGQITTMLCGGTLVFDNDGIVLSWAYKPGSVPYGGKRERSGTIKQKWDFETAEGVKRRKALLDRVAMELAAGRVGSLIGSAKGLLGTYVPAFISEEQAGRVQFRLSPHLHLSKDHQLKEEKETRPWEISC